MHSLGILSYRNVVQYLEVTIMYIIMILGSIINVHFYETFSTFISKLKLSLSLFRHCVIKLKVLESACASLLIKTLSIQTQASSLGLLITLVNNFQFNSVVMFVHFVNQSSVINLIYSK